MTARDGPDALVFGTSTRRRQSESKMGQRMLATSVKWTNGQLAKGGGELLPHLTHYSLRRTFASILFAIGETPPCVIGQTGHKTAALTLEVYARTMSRRDVKPQRLAALANGASGRSTQARARSDRHQRAA